MNDFLMYLQTGRGYSDYEIKLLKYFFKAMLYELSKFVIMGIFFLCTGYFFEYLVAVTVLLLVRTSLGGLHFKSYMSCFIFTTVFFMVSIVLLPHISVPKWLMLAALLVCLVLNNYIGPITSSFRPTPDGVLIRKSKKNSTVIIFIYCLMVFILSQNHYLNIGFWVIILQTLQLSFAYLINVRR